MSAIPKGWRESSIGEITESMKNGIYKPKDAYADDGYACLRMYNIENGAIVWKDIKRMHLTDGELETYQLMPGDLLVNRVNSRELVGKTAVIPTGLEPCVYESKNIRLRVRRDLAEPKFVSYKLLLDGSKHFDRNAQQVVGMASISQPQIAAFPIPLPPIAEQRRIVAQIEELFSRLDAGVAALHQAKAQLQRYRQSVLAAAVTGELTKEWREQNPDVESGEELLELIVSAQNAYFESNSEDSEIKRHVSKHKRHKFRTPKYWDTPKTWRFASLLTSCQLVVDCYNKTPPYQELGIPLIRTTNVRNGKLAWQKMKFVNETTAAHWSQRCTPKSGDILFTREAPAGEAAIIPDSTRICMGQRMMLFRTFHDLLLPSYLLVVIQSHNFRAQYGDKQVGMGVQHLRVGDVESLALPIPPVTEQRQIVKQVEVRTTAIDHLEAEIDRLITHSNHLRRSTLMSAFAGEFTNT